MALQAIFDRWGMHHSLTPILCNFIMATETDHGLPFFEDMIVRRTMGRVTGDAVFIHSRFMGGLGVLDDLVDILVAFKAKFTRFLLYHIGKVSRVWRVAAMAFALGHRCMGLYGVASILNGLVAGGAKISVFVICLEIFLLFGSMKLMTACAVCGGKGLVETETPSLVRLFLMTGKAECGLGRGQKILICRLMGQVTGITGLFGRRLMAGTALSEGFLFMAVQTEGFLIVFELGLTGRAMAIMT